MNRLSPITLAAILGLVSATATAQGNLDDVQITTQELAPGVAVLFGAGGNIGVSHGDDATVIIDDQFAPLTTKINNAIADLGATPVKFVVNTHWHFDHTGGNENLGNQGATIFAHDNVRVRMIEGSAEGSRFPVPPAPDVALPVVTFPQGMRFHLNDDTISVMFLGGGHTDGDSVVFWEQNNIVHIGDLYFNIPGYPFVDIASGGNARNLLSSVTKVIEMIDDKTQIIPGHGPMSNKAELIAYRDMIGEAISRVDKARADGLSLEEAVEADLLSDFDRGEGGFIDADAFVTAIWNSPGE